LTAAAASAIAAAVTAAATAATTVTAAVTALRRGYIRQCQAQSEDGTRDQSFHDELLVLVRAIDVLPRR
jgi:hypothetical protein